MPSIGSSCERDRSAEYRHWHAHYKAMGLGYNKLNEMVWRRMRRRRR